MIKYCSALCISFGSLKAIKLEEKLLVQVAREVLGRDWQESDGNMFERVFTHDNGIESMNYDLSYNGLKIGTVKRFWEESTFKIQFEPSNN